MGIINWPLWTQNLSYCGRGPPGITYILTNPNNLWIQHLQKQSLDQLSSWFVAIKHACFEQTLQLWFGAMTYAKSTHV
jgi:hypothetical protein